PLDFTRVIASGLPAGAAEVGVAPCPPWASFCASLRVQPAAAAATTPRSAIRALRVAVILSSIAPAQLIFNAPDRSAPSDATSSRVREVAPHRSLHYMQPALTRRARVPSGAFSGDVRCWSP